jgi:uncharacterized protein (DUF305 family)
MNVVKQNILVLSQTNARLKQCEDDMQITGYKHGADADDAISAIIKHTTLSISMSRKMVEDAISGKIINLNDDFVLREDLNDAGFVVE